MKSRIALACIVIGSLIVPAAAMANDTNMPRHAATTTTTTTTTDKSANAKEAMSDAAITTKIKSSFAADRDVSATHIKVETDNGVVHLSGMARNAQEAQRATAIARETKGVVSVDDKIEVTNGAPK